MKQAEKIYLISDAAKQVQVESHVLRYWEEELELPIKRNELGHRYYTEEDITMFKEVRDLKERGLQLKAIRTLLSREVKGKEKEPLERHVVMVNKGQFMPVQEESREAKSLRLQQLLQQMIAEAVRSNNREVCEEIKESVIKELDYQFRLQDEREEEREEARICRQEAHYRQIDELLRTRSKKRGFGAKNDDEKRANEAKKEEKTRRKEKQNADDNERQEEIQLLLDEGIKKEKPVKGFLRKKRSIS